MNQDPAPPQNRKPRSGRPSVFTPKVRAAILEARRLLVPLKHAARAAGISYDTLHEWMRRGELDEKEEYFQFFQQIRQAEAQGILDNLQIINEAAKRDWRAAAHLLERTFPQEFGRLDRNLSETEIQALAKETVRELTALVPYPHERLRIVKAMKAAYASDEIHL